MMKMTTTKTTMRRPLIAGVLRETINRSGIADTHRPRLTDEERRHVRAAVREGRDVRERTIDHVVDRLLEELTW